MAQYASPAERLELANFRIHSLEQALGCHEEFPALRLTNKERIILGVLMKRRIASTDTFMTAMYDDAHRDAPYPNIVKVLMHKLRKKLAPHGIEIENVWGQGWLISEANKYRVRDLG